MKKIIDFLISMQTMGVLLVIYAVAMAAATFIENDYGAITAKAAVYNAWWFNLLHSLLVMNMLGNIFKYKLYTLKKISMFIFHLAFIIIILAAAITRFTGYEGMMYIRENDTSNRIVTEKTYISIKARSGGEDYKKIENVFFSPVTKNRFSDKFTINNKSVSVKNLAYIPNANIVLKDFIKIADLKLFSDVYSENEGMDACQLEIKVDDITRIVYVWGKPGMVHQAISFQINDVDLELYFGSLYYYLPFTLKLNDFQLERYPGSNSPSSYASEVTIIDKEKNINEPYRIFMNHVLDYRGYRFFQSSYDRDEKGTVLSVNHDKPGTLLTYLGYFLLAFGMLLTLFNKHSRFLSLAKESSGLHSSRIAKILLIGILLGSSSILPTKSTFARTDKIKTIDIEHAKSFGELLILDRGGRVKPVNTMASEVLRKVVRKDNYQGLNPEQVFLGMISDTETWQHVKMIRVSDPELKKILGLEGKYAAYSDMIDMQSQTYILKQYVDIAHSKKPSMQNKFDKYIIKVDERMNVLYMAFVGNFMSIFPVPNDPDNRWVSISQRKRDFTGEDSLFVSGIFNKYLESLNKAVETGDYTEANQNLDYMKKFQQEYGAEIIPSDKSIKFEIWYNNIDLFKRIAYLYGLIGFIMLVLLFVNILIPKVYVTWIINICSVIILFIFTLHTTGLIIRWYVSGHAPWSNGYESMIYIGWATILAGFIFFKKSAITLSATAILTFLILYVAHMSWMDPQITNLVPVLDSYWLTIHVAIITASYGFLALGFIIGFLVLLLMIFRTTKNDIKISDTIKQISLVNEMTLIAGLFLLTIGTFLGGVWANESWGRYWGWDPKETWALITIIVYSFIVHMRMIPGLRGSYAFNFASVIGYFSVIMTYFGVNYYLSGLHSYASGDPVPIPNFVYFTVAIIFIVAIIAYTNERSYKKIDSISAYPQAQA